MCLCASPTFASSNQSRLLVVVFFQIIFKFSADSPIKNPYFFCFLDSVMVNTTVHTEFIGCRKHWMQSGGCLLRIAREAQGKNTDSLAAETHGHINSAGCEGMATTVTNAHHSICRHLHDSMHAAQKPESRLMFVTLDKESNMSTLWRREDFLRICSKENLADKAQSIEVTIPD